MYRALIFTLLISCQVQDNRQDKSVIQSLMDDQQSAWNAGNIDGFMSSYHPDICFLGRKGQTCGKDEVTANYRESYPNKDAMGELKFDNWEVELVGGDHAWVSGTWKLFRSDDTLGGRYSLLWQRDAEGWLILRDHSDIACE